MLSPEEKPSPFQTRTSPTTKTFAIRTKPSLLSDSFLFAAGASVSLFLVWALSDSFNPTPDLSSFNSTPLKCAGSAQSTINLNLHPDPPTANFYDDPNLTYSFKNTIKNWDFKRQDWLRQHPEFTSVGHADRILLITGSQPSPCKNPIGDHLLFRLFKNKVDYCRINGYDIFYNNALLNPKMGHYWAKLPIIRAAMLAHPEIEWIWWVDSDASFTDMDFRLPLAKYKSHNLIVHGWPREIYERKSWVGLNAGVFLIRNCQWSMDFMDVWANMGPQSPEYEKWGEIQQSVMKNKRLPESDDQAALVYFLLEEKGKWGNKIYLESDFYFEGYWVEIVGTLANVTEKYRELERGVRRLRRRHAEKVSGYYGEIREEHMKGWGIGQGSLRRPFITHFVGCEPCSGTHNEIYTWESCREGMERALNFADDQVLRNFGFGREDLLDVGTVVPREYDFPA
ncbi:glycosyltransferase 6-like [Magnolia sinica]|uniref:glycosyltransferase 6-like n=1 Tax=Magnolia sinica TaxID=86752 RepID=UPI002657C595|nr:glycosyltransferase 6-like [Magnolia sinica]